MTLEERLDRYLGQEPQIAADAYVHPRATVIGDVVLGERCSIWPGAVLRADINAIRIGNESNVQDGTVLHLSNDFGVHIGEGVSIGHLAMVHACTVEDHCLIGMSSTILDGAVIGEGSMIGAKALVKQGMHVPPGSLVLGVPGKVVRQLSEEEREGIKALAQKYVGVAKAHRARG